MKTNKLQKAMTLLLGLEFFVSPLAHADGNKTQQVFQGINQATQTASGLMQMVQSQQQQMQQQLITQQLLDQLTVEPVPSYLSKYPAFQECTLPIAVTREPQVGFKCESEHFNPAMMPYYEALKQKAEQNMDVFRLFMVEGNAESNQGESCLTGVDTKLAIEAQEVMNAIASEKTNLEALRVKAEEESKQLLEEIKLDNAKLHGTPVEKLEGLELFKEFKDDPMCSTIADLNIDDKNNYLAISKEITKNVEAKEGKGGFSARSFSKEAPKIESDYKKFTEDLRKEAERRIKKGSFPDSDPSSILKSVKSKYDFSANPAVGKVFSNVTSQIATAKAELDSQVGAKLSSSESRVKALLNDPNQNTTDIAVAYQNAAYTACIEDSFKKFDGLGAFTGKLDQQSKQGADNPLGNEFISILSDSNLSLKERLSKISSINATSYTSYRIGKSSPEYGLSAGSDVNVLALLNNVVVKDCERYFKTDNGSGLTPNEILTKIQDFHKTYKQKVQNFHNDLKNELDADVLSCSNSSGARATSCSASSFSLSSPSFCIAEAKSCSGNMISCENKIQKVVKDTRAKLSKNAKVFKATFDEEKKKRRAQYLQFRSTMDARFRNASLSKLFGKATFKVPEIEDLSILTKKEDLVPGLDPSLEIEDTNKFYERMKTQVDNYEKKIGEYFEGIKQEIAKQKADIKAKAQAEYQKWEAITNACQSRLSEFDRQQAENIQKQQEETSKKQEGVRNFCAKIATSPCPDFDMNDMGNILAALNPSSDDMAALKEMQEGCSYQKMSIEELQNEDDYRPFISVNDACSNNSAFKMPGELCTSYKTPQSHPTDNNKGRDLDCDGVFKDKTIEITNRHYTECVDLEKKIKSAWEKAAARELRKTKTGKNSFSACDNIVRDQAVKDFNQALQNNGMPYQGTYGR